MVRHAWSVDDRNLKITGSGNSTGRVIKGGDANRLIVPLNYLETEVVIFSTSVKPLVEPNISSVTIDFCNSTSIFRPEDRLFFYIWVVGSSSSLTLEHRDSSIISWAHPVGQEGGDFRINPDVSFSEVSSVDELDKFSSKSFDQIKLGVLFGDSTSKPFKGLPFKELEESFKFIGCHVVEGSGFVPVVAW